MNMKNLRRWRVIASLSVIAIVSSGCLYRGYAGGPRAYYQGASAPAPLGTLSDPMWQMQEDNAEPEKFVVYQHEFELNGVRLNPAGEDHVKQIAARLTAGQNFPVIVERSFTNPRDNTEYNFPVHTNPNLDMHRREVLVQILTSLGIADAPQRVVVSMAIAHGYTDQEAERAYWRTQFSSGGNGGFGGGFGGFGGFGGGGGGGGGFGGGFR